MRERALAEKGDSKKSVPQKPATKVFLFFFCFFFCFFLFFCFFVFCFFVFLFFVFLFCFFFVFFLFVYSFSFKFSCNVSFEKIAKKRMDEEAHDTSNP